MDQQKANMKVFWGILLLTLTPAFLSVGLQPKQPFSPRCSAGYLVGLYILAFDYRQEGIEAGRFTVAHNRPGLERKLNRKPC